MFQASEDAALLQEPAPQLVGVQFGAHELDGYALPEVALFAHRKVDGAHPSAPQLAHNTVRTNTLAGLEEALVSVRGAVQSPHHIVQHPVGVVCVQQCAHVAAEVPVTPARSVEPAPAEPHGHL